MFCASGITCRMLLRSLAITVFIAAALRVSLACPEGEVAEKFLLHFQPDQPRGVPGVDVADPTPLLSPLHIGPVTLIDTHIQGLNNTVIHSFNILAHLFTGSLDLSFPKLVLTGVYELPGLWWTTTGDFSVTLTDVHALTRLKVAVLHDSCFYVQDYQTAITTRNLTYTTDGLLDDSGMLDFLFDDIIEMLVNVTKPTILEMVNKQLRISLTTFLPPSTMLVQDLSSAETTPVIPSREEQVQALNRFVRFQIPWMIGDPLLLPNVTMNILNIAELHNMSVHNLEKVTDVQHLSLTFNGDQFILETKMLHQDIYNRHRVLWFPSTFFKTWQWTEASLGLVKHRAVLVLDRRLMAPPRLQDVLMRPVMFNPGHNSASVRRMSRLARKLLDGIRTEFGDTIRAFLYSPIVTKVNRILREVDTRQLVRDFVCYAASGTALNEQP